jgi:hypothetical protein
MAGLPVYGLQVPSPKSSKNICYIAGIVDSGSHGNWYGMTKL